MLGDGSSTSEKMESNRYAYRCRHKNVYLSVYNTESCKEPEIGVINSGLKKKEFLSSRMFSSFYTA